MSEALAIRLRPLLALRLALREMRGGLKGFYIFLACIALGTAAIAGVNSLSQSITATIASQGRELLAGDIRFELNNRVATTEERAFLDGLGPVSVSAGLRSMARLPDGSNQALVELKAVDAAYPLYASWKANRISRLAVCWRGRATCSVRWPHRCCLIASAFPSVMKSCWAMPASRFQARSCASRMRSPTDSASHRA